MSTPANTTPAVSLHAELEAVLKYPHDPISATELEGILKPITGICRATISDAFKDGVITTTASCLRRNGKQENARRRASKSAIIAWLWDSQAGDKTMLRAALEHYAPHVLKALDRRDSKRRLSVVLKAAPDAEAKPSAQLLLFAESA